ncbi:MAG: hypothetical protein ABSA96_02780 [Candidatus Acidiferrales bacterium]|jgi:hypothetical protein
MNAQNSPQPTGPQTPIIPARHGRVTTLRISAFLAIMTAVVLRMLFIFRFPASAGDSELYLQLAYNWLDHRTYSLWLNGHLVPTDLRMPGYPALLAGIAMTVGRSLRAISLSQAAIDLSTCCLTAMLAAGLAPKQARRRVWLAALWLAATCPFVANYTAVVLTEALVTCVATAALACFVWGVRRIPRGPEFVVQPRRIAPLKFAVLGSFLTGLATLIRPEMPLLFVAAALVYAFRVWGVLNIRKLALCGAAMAGAFLLPLAPWATRNFLTLHKVQILAPRYSTLPDEYAPVGYYAWAGTWLERYRDVYLSIWKISEEPIDIEDLPSSAFDSPQEKARVADLTDQYNMSPDLEISPEVDAEFARLARERTKRHPFRTYIRVPFERALTVWFTPRTELLPVDGKVWPLRERWQDAPVDVLTTAGLGALGYLYIALAAGGVWVAWRTGHTDGGASGLPNDSRDAPNLWGISLLLAYLMIRTAFLTTVEAPEPRYVVSCYPAVLALAAMLFARARIFRTL